MSKAVHYATQALAASGFAILGSQVAVAMRPDIWSSAMECSGDFVTAKQRNAFAAIPGVHRRQVKLAGVDRPLMVLTRSLDMLEKRIEWVTGFKVETLTDEELPEPVRTVTPAPVVEAKRSEESRIARLRDIANEKLPTHDCQLRKDIIAAREELAQQAA